jgi:hypothetical protein
LACQEGGTDFGNDNIKKKTANGQETRKKKITGLITMARQFNNEPEMTLPANGPSTEEGNAHGDRGNHEEEIDGAAKDPQGRIVRHCIVQRIQD